jgi:phosphate transport system protein
MKRHFDDEILKIKGKLLKMGLLVEEAIANSATALFERDSKKAQMVVDRDQEINVYEIEIDELGHEFIALYQPAARDLRLLTMILKITNDLERMGDQAVNIAQKALYVNGEPQLIAYDDFRKMYQNVLMMVRDAINAFMDADIVKAKLILESDDMVDQIDDKIAIDILKQIKAKPDQAQVGVCLILASHNFERIADLATNLAEDVIYLKQGIDVRHHIRERRDQ